MDKAAKILIGGVVVATIVFGIGKGNAYRSESKLRQLEAECINEGKKETLAKSFGGVLICDPTDLIRSESNKTSAVGIQAKLVASQKDVWDSESWSLPLAITLLILSALPWFWYFLLRRIRELRDAISGK